MTFTISPPSKALISSPIRSSWPRMNLAFNIPSTAISLKFSSFRVSALIPARDRVIDFGKYKGKMLGSLPSTYLKWVSRNLRAGDTEEWAKMADEVLADPVYRDRMEWEAAEKILNGNTASHCSRSGNGRNAVSELLEISERFGWDNEDKSGWSKIDFGLLGTSKGGRIPRVAAADKRSNVEVGKLKKSEKNEEDGGRRRTERRERVRQRLREKKTSVSVSGGAWTAERTIEEEGEASPPPAPPAEGVVVRSPFPGREALLKKALNRQRL